MFIAIIIVALICGIGIGAAVTMAAFEREAAMNRQYFTQSTTDTTTTNNSDN